MDTDQSHSQQSKVGSPNTEDKQAYQYYWCVNCGHHGNFGKLRKTRLYCRECGYDDLSLYTHEEIENDKDLKQRRFLRRKV